MPKKKCRENITILARQPTVVLQHKDRLLISTQSYLFLNLDVQ